VGIGTILSDDPDLTVREVEGANPQPIILDSKLRFPIGANMLRNSGPPAWIFCGPNASIDKKKKLEAAGLRVSAVSIDEEGKLNLDDILETVYSEGFRSIMVEGGRQIITGFIINELVDHVVITLTPSLLGGLNAIGDINKLGNIRPRLRNIGYEKLGDDFIVWGTPDWENIEK
jgi:riboflavin-specific deaminase-like protein